MVYLSETKTYEKKLGKLYEIIKREVDPNSLNDDIASLENIKAEKDDKINEIMLIKNL